MKYGDTYFIVMVNAKTRKHENFINSFHFINNAIK